jgi:hypothetical protein
MEEIKLAEVWVSENLYQSAMQLFSLEEGVRRSAIKLPKPRLIKLLLILIKTALMKTIEFFGHLINRFRTAVSDNKVAEKQSFKQSRREQGVYDSPFLKNTFKKK